MKVGDIIQVKFTHWHKAGEIGLLVEDPFPSTINRGKAFRVLFSDGEEKTMVAKHLEVISCL